MSRNNSQLQENLQKYLHKGKYSPSKSEQVRQHYKQSHPIVLRNTFVVINHTPQVDNTSENARKLLNKLFGIEE